MNGTGQNNIYVTRLHADGTIGLQTRADLSRPFPNSSPWFRRGDADSDGRVTLTDAIFLLNHLFGGGPAPAIPDAADADDSGAPLTLTDALRILLHLFQGGAVPPPPYPGAGRDPTEDPLE